MSKRPAGSDIDSGDDVDKLNSDPIDKPFNQFLCDDMVPQLQARNPAGLYYTYMRLATHCFVAADFLTMDVDEDFKKRQARNKKRREPRVAKCAATAASTENVNPVHKITVEPPSDVGAIAPSCVDVTAYMPMLSKTCCQRNRLEREISSASQMSSWSQLLA
jgi:hypothetical protein